MIKEIMYKRLGLLCCLALLGLLLNCKSSDISKEEQYTIDIATLETLIEKDAYYVDIEVVYPFVTAATQQVVNALFLSRTGNSANRVDVSGDGHFIDIQNDSVKGNLSFFGERRLSSGSYGGRNSGIVFDGLPENYEKTINEKKRKLEIRYTISQNEEPSESYDVILEIFPNKKVVVDITSTFKTFIRYSGTLKPQDAVQ